MKRNTDKKLKRCKAWISKEDTCDRVTFVVLSHFIRLGGGQQTSRGHLAVVSVHFSY